VAAGFLGGAAIGVAGGAALGVVGTMATYSVYHRYHRFKRMMYLNNPYNYQNNYGQDWDDNYYDNYYSNNLCLFGCPGNSHCEWGFCECDAGTARSYGQCRTSRLSSSPRTSSFSPLSISCNDIGTNSTSTTTSTCATHDINLICNTNLTTSGTQGHCQCRKDMRWNTEASECQIYLDVDCSTITYETPPSSAIMSAVAKANQTVTEAVQPTDRTQNANESLANSLLTNIDPTNVTSDELKEAFCRDIDAYSLEFQEKKDERPSQLCDLVPETACAMLYDSGTCSGGWKYVLPEGQLRFRYFSSYWKYRNDMDTVGVKAGCTFTGFSDSSFNGNSVVLRAEQWDKWVVFANHAQYANMDEDIESVRCSCG